MDTTLRDGEQTSGVSFVPHEKLMIARLLLEDLKVDRIEVASARVSDGEFNAVKMICDWAARRGLLQRVEVLGFVDGKMSVDWIHDAGGQVINLLSKGSEKHCRYQLKKTLEEHLADIRNTVDYAHERGLEVNLYLEDWSNGIKDSPDYVFGLVDGLRDIGIRRFMLPDTLGILNPLQVIEFMRKMKKRYPDLHFDFHAHNDYDLAVSNVLAAVLSGVKGLHTTINGLGERAGNAPLASVQAILKDHFHAITRIDESRLNDVSRVVESYSGVTIPATSIAAGEEGLHAGFIEACARLAVHDTPVLLLCFDGPVPDFYQPWVPAQLPVHAVAMVLTRGQQWRYQGSEAADPVAPALSQPLQFWRSWLRGEPECRLDGGAQQRVWRC